MAYNFFTGKDDGSGALGTPTVTEYYKSVTGQNYLVTPYSQIGDDIRYPRLEGESESLYRVRVPVEKGVDKVREVVSDVGEAVDSGIKYVTGNASSLSAFLPFIIGGFIILLILKIFRR